MLVETGLSGALHDPLVLYPALAALVLAAVSLATGLLRGDALALARPIPVLWLVATVAVVWAAALAAAAAPDTWQAVLTDSARAPLYVFALAYGSLPGLVAAALVAAWVPLEHPSDWGAWLLTLEVVVIGWLAVGPSPRRSRWTGPAYALLAYALAWGTAGLSVLVLERGDVTAALLFEQHAATPAMVLGVAALLALLGPSGYDRAFPSSWIAPEGRRLAPDSSAARDAASPVSASSAPATPFEVPPLQRPGRRRRTLTPYPESQDDA